MGARYARRREPIEKDPVTSQDPQVPGQGLPPPPGAGPSHQGPWAPPGRSPEPSWKPGPGLPAPPSGGLPGPGRRSPLGFGKGPVPLRPMTLGDILDGGFKLFAANWRTVLVVAGAFLVPLHLASAFFQRDLLGGLSFLQLLSDPAAAQALTQGRGGPGQVLGPLLGGLAAVFVLPFVAGAISKVVAASYLGQRMDAGPALRATARRWWSLVAAWLLTHLLQLVPYVAGVAVIAAGVVAEAAALAILGFLLLLAGLAGHLAVMTAFVAVAPAIVVEELGPLEAMRRSVRLVRPGFWRVLGAALVSGLLAGILSGIVGAIPSTAALFVGMRHGWILLALGSILGGLVATPFIAIVATLIYFDGRIRGEGFDLQAMAAELERGGLPAG